MMSHRVGTCWEPDPGGPARYQPEEIVMTRITVEIAEPTVQLADDEPDEPQEPEQTAFL